jgi:hypothetical protein
MADESQDGHKPSPTDAVKAPGTKKHLAETFWAVVVGVILFFLGVAWQKFVGPDDVVVRETAAPTDTAYVRLVPDSTSLDSAMLNTLRNIHREISKLATEAPPQVRLPGGALSSNFKPNSLNVPAFDLPPSVMGWHLGSIAPYAAAECPPSEVSPGALLELKFMVLPGIDIADFTPVFLRVTRVSDPSHPAGVMVLDEQYRLRTGQNLIVLAVSFPPGDYRIGYGFFRRSELKEKYPSWFSLRCNVHVTGTS